MKHHVIYNIETRYRAISKNKQQEQKRNLDCIVTFIRRRYRNDFNSTVDLRCNWEYYNTSNTLKAPTAATLSFRHKKQSSQSRSQIKKYVSIWRSAFFIKKDALKWIKNLISRCWSETFPKCSQFGTVSCTTYPKHPQMFLVLCPIYTEYFVKILC